MIEDEERIRVVAREAAKEAVRDMLERLGVDADDFVEVQKDFQHLRDWRLSVAAIKRQGLISAVGVLTMGMLGLIWMALKTGAAPHH
jgi:hypothetical protein